MNYIRNAIFAVMGVSALWYGACDGAKRVDFSDVVDLQPPQLERVGVGSASSVEFCFDEPVEVVAQSLQAEAPLEIGAHRPIECGFALDLRTEMVRGRRYTISVTVADDNGNSLDIITNVYGYNDDIPQMIINEFTTRGSGRHPDVVELYLQTAGNIGGVTLYEGSMDNWTAERYCRRWS